MKNTLIAALFTFMSINSFANTQLLEPENDMVPAAMVEDLKSAKAGFETDESNGVMIRLMSVFTGTAYGISHLLLTVLDSGPSEGDYGNTYTYDLGAIVGETSNLKLSRDAKGDFILSYNAESIDLSSDDGEAKTIDASKAIRIQLDAEGLLTNIEEIN